ncbi:WYL domain-containing protein [bacterium]|nr:WYL domain-containing protein [bacterium]
MAKINKYNALERILDIINTLCERNRITIKELANRYGFSTDIIIEDLNYIHNTEVLDLTLFPEDPSYDYEDDNFTEQLKKCDEQGIPIIVGRYVRNKDPEKLSLQISEVEKLFLNSFLNESETAGDILIKNAPEYASKERVEILYQLDKAIKNKETLKVDYDREKDLVITPLHIVRMPADNCYYCMADCCGNIRYFRTDKLSVVEVVRQDRGISQEKIDREIEFLDLRWGMNGREPFDFEMVVYNEADLPRRLKIELKNRKNAVWEELSDGKWRYKDKVIDFESLKTWVLGLGKSVKVVKPQKMADEILADAKKRYEYYRKFFEVTENESSQPEERGKAD